jgi:hypothetical protein
MANTSNRGDAQFGQAREQAETAKGHLQQAGQEVKQAASSAASGLAQKTEDTADDALASMGQRMTTMAGSLRQTSQRQGVVGTAAGAVADRLESGGRYLQEHGVGEITDDVAGIIRRNPLPALCAAFGVGLFIGLAVSRR